MPSAVTYHDHLARGWDQRYQSGSFRRRYEFIRRLIIDSPVKGGASLDAGCGTGTFSRMLLQLGADSVKGVDAAREMIEQARLFGRDGAQKEMSFDRIETVENLPFYDAAFDNAICLSVLEYVPDPRAAVAELARVLKPGGTCIVSIPHKRSFVRWLQRASVLLSGTFVRDLAYLESSNFLLEPEEAEEFFCQEGFEVVAVRGFDPLIPEWLFSIFTPSLMFYILRRSQTRSGI